MKDKRILYMATFIMGGIILVIVIVLIFINIFGGKMSYEKVEDKMKSAAVSYLKSREEELPKSNGNTITLSVDTLVGAKKMKALDKIVPDGSSCTGNVVVTKNGDNYLYSPMLDCGSDYRTKKLYEVVTAADNIVIDGEGLYAKENGYVFKGENVNNLVQIDEGLWAIIDIDKDGYARLVYLSPKKNSRSVWDDRYNLTEDGYDGINDFSVSRLKEYLEELSTTEDYLIEDSKAYVALRKWCVGKRSETNLAINNDEECSVLSEELMFGLPYVSDTAAASIDKNCKDIDDESCSNYNYFSVSSWSLTGIKESTSRSYYLVGTAYVPYKTSTTRNIVPTIYLSDNVIYASGDGSIDNPYTLK